MDKSIIVNYISTNWMIFSIVIAILIAGYIINMILVRYDKSGKILKILTALCIEAEKYLGSGTGKLKKEHVIGRFVDKHPIISTFIGNEILNKMVDNAVEGIHEYLQSLSKQHDSPSNNE